VKAGQQCRKAVLLALKGADHAPPEAAADRPLYHEIVAGVHRERLFLDHIAAPFVQKKPRPGLRDLLHTLLYQLLFLDGVPQYAAFAATQAAAEELGFSRQELAFAHGVAKKVLPLAAAHLEERAQALASVRDEKDLDDAAQAAFNLPRSLLGAMAKAADWATALTAAAALKERASLVGYALAGEDELPGTENLGSEVAPGALRFTDGAAMKTLLNEGLVWMQGEGSQWACAEAARALQSLSVADGKIRVLEMAAGKGGKTLRTQLELCAADNTFVDRLHWECADRQLSQLQLLETGVLPRLTALGGAVAEVRPWDWLEQGVPEEDQGTWHFTWLDAPCSGLGTLSKNPEIAGRLKADDLAGLAQTQLDLLHHAAKLTAPGGLIFFTLCTLTARETQGTVKAFLKAHPEFTLTWSRTLWPGSDELVTADGFYAAMLERRS
jgi:16S rRNA (cytosine967-C5)-methyltransferase